jgi:hypothetical protein
VPRGNDFCNNELLNARAHNADQSIVDDEDRFALRGIPAVGKLLYTVAGGEGGEVGGRLLVCSDTDPDPTFDGGGIYSSVMYGEDEACTVSLTQTVDVGGGTGSMTRVYRFRSADGEFGRAWVTAQMTVGDNGTASSAVEATLEPVGINLAANGTDDRHCGTWNLLRSSAYVSSGFVLTDGASTTPTKLLFREWGGDELGSAFTMTVGDVLSFEVQFTYTLTFA